jgi:Acetyltransferase (GNAT) domain
MVETDLTVPLQEPATPTSQITLLTEPQVRTYFALDALPAPYREAFDGTASADFHASLPWFDNFVRFALDPADRVRLYGVEVGHPAAKAVALLPMKHRAAHSLFEPRVLSSLTNYYTCLFEPLLGDGGNMKLAIRQIVAALRVDQPRWDVLRFAPMAHESFFFLELRDALVAAGFAPQEFFSFGNWYLPVEGRSYQQYLAGRPSALQNTLRRKSKKMDQTGRARIEIIAGEADVEKAVEDYAKVYGASWKVPEPYPSFIPNLIRTCARQGWLRLGLVYMDGVPIASQLWIVQGNVASIYKLAYDEQFAALSAGTILTARLMQHVLDIDHVREIDYLSGDDDYKKTWMSHRRERWGLLAFNPRTIKGVLSMARHIGGRQLKRAYQRVRRRPVSPVQPALNT